MLVLTKAQLWIFSLVQYLPLAKVFGETPLHKAKPCVYKMDQILRWTKVSIQGDYAK